MSHKICCVDISFDMLCFGCVHHITFLQKSKQKKDRRPFLKRTAASSEASLFYASALVSVFFPNASTTMIMSRSANGSATTAGILLTAKMPASR